MSKEDVIYVVYDDDCPFCRNYCKYVRLKENVGNLHLVDARKELELMNEITKMGLDIDQGMVLKIDARIYYGADAIHILSLLSSRSGIFNRINYYIFNSEKASKILYPFLRDCRSLALKVMGIPFIKNLEKP